MSLLALSKEGGGVSSQPREGVGASGSRGSGSRSRHIEPCDKLRGGVGGAVFGELTLRTKFVS